MGIVRIASSTHAMSNTIIFAIIYEVSWSKLGPLFVMKYQIVICIIRWKSLFQRLNSQIWANPFTIQTGNNAMVIKVNNTAIIALSTVYKCQMCKIRSPNLVWVFSTEILIKQIFKVTMEVALLVSLFLTSVDCLYANFTHVSINRT